MRVACRTYRALVALRLIVERSLFVLAAFLLLVVSCSWNPTRNPKGEELVMAVAQKEALKRGWSEVEVKRVVFTNGHWEVLIWRIPNMPGGFATVTVTPDGRVTKFEPGE